MKSDLRPYLTLTAFLLVAISEVHGNCQNPKTTAPNHPECFDDKDKRLIQCTKETLFRPSVCDCGNRKKCYVRLVITTNPEPRGTRKKYSVNGGRIGPTIIINHNAILAVDVINNMKDDDTSIHWHGMHQKNVPWMDGVASVTQYGIPPNGGKFRYILRAHPSGTHWYHAHVGTQRDEGVFGALIVKEKKRLLHKGDHIEDFPGRHTLSVTEHMRISQKKRGCTEDGSAVPVKDELVTSFQINGVTLQKSVDKDEQEPSYLVERGKNYRFRVIGAVDVTVFRISIDGHKLVVVSTDSYLTEPFETDVVHVHVGERYDFIVKTRTDVAPGTTFPIRIESVEVYCNNHDQPAGVGIAYLRYSAPVQEEPCKKDCVALNCPFEHYPVVKGVENAPAYTCFTVYQALKLLVPTPTEELPENTNPPPAVENFFNFEFHHGPRVNNVKYVFPKVPFAMSDGPVKDECAYDNIKKECSGKGCPHAVYVRKRKSHKSIEFVFSSLPETPGKTHIANLITHPIHLHGHSFWVTKIGFPKYSKDGTIEKVNKDIVVPACGHGKWKNGIRPDDIRVDERTIRKDVIIVPAGGYVVIEFLATNPGWWIMHCHIDPHLLNGMAIAVGEETQCQNPPPQELKAPTREFCWSVEDFKKKEEYQCDTTKKSTENCRANADEKRPIPNETDEEFDVRSKMEESKSAGENDEEEWLNPGMILAKYMKKKQKWL